MGFGMLLRNLGAKIAAGYRRFMQGRYGGDKLNMIILWSGVIACILSLIIPVHVIKIIFLVISYGLMGWAIFRAFSTNTYKRYQENRKYLRLMDRLKDRKHRHFECPKCRQPVRVPKGKGRIAITCPKCREKFIKNT